MNPQIDVLGPSSSRVNMETNYDHTTFLGLVSSQKETTTTKKENPNLLVEVQAKTYYYLKKIARKFRKYG